MKKVVCIDASNSELKNGNYYWVQDDEVDDAYYNILLPKGLEDGFWFKHRFKDVTEKKKVKNWIRHEGVDYPVYEEEKKKIMKKIRFISPDFDNLKKGKIYNGELYETVMNEAVYTVYDGNNYIGEFLANNFEEVDEINTPNHYDNSNGSLYDISHKLGLNPWEFDIIKRVVRCRKKGSFVEDLEKTKVLIDIYLKEWKQKNVSDATK